MDASLGGGVSGLAKRLRVTADAELAYSKSVKGDMAGSVRVGWRFCIVDGAVEVESRRAVGAVVVTARVVISFLFVLTVPRGGS